MILLVKLNLSIGVMLMANCIYMLSAKTTRISKIANICFFSLFIVWLISVIAIIWLS